MEENYVPKGEDQFLFGLDDAKILEGNLSGLGSTYFACLMSIGQFVHQEYLKGFISFYNENK